MSGSFSSEEKSIVLVEKPLFALHYFKLLEKFNNAVIRLFSPMNVVWLKIQKHPLSLQDQLRHK